MHGLLSDKWGLDVEFKTAKIKIILLLIMLLFVFVTIFAFFYSQNKSTNKNNDPELNQPEEYTAPGAEDFPVINNSYLLIKEGVPEKTVLDLNRLFYDFNKKNTTYLLNEQSIYVSYDGDYVKRPYLFKFSVDDAEDKKTYYCEIINNDEYFIFNVYSNDMFNNILYSYDSSSENDEVELQPQ
jgi:hypothetical protein